MFSSSGEELRDNQECDLRQGWERFRNPGDNSFKPSGGFQNIGRYSSSTCMSAAMIVSTVYFFSTPNSHTQQYTTNSFSSSISSSHKTFIFNTPRTLGNTFHSHRIIPHTTTNSSLQTKLTLTSIGIGIQTHTMALATKTHTLALALTTSTHTLALALAYIIHLHS